MYFAWVRLLKVLKGKIREKYCFQLPKLDVVGSTPIARSIVNRVVSSLFIAVLFLSKIIFSLSDQYGGWTFHTSENFGYKNTLTTSEKGIEKIQFK